MAAIDEIVQVQITIESATIDRAGFGTPLIAAVHNFWPETVRTFGTLAELTDEGVPATDPIFLCATKLLSQEFKPPLFKVGKRRLAFNDTWTLEPTNIEEGFEYDFEVGINGLPQTNITHLNGAAETVTAIVADLAAQIDAITDITTMDTDPEVLISATTGGQLVRISGFDPTSMIIQNATADPGLATDLAAIEAADSNWYGLLLDSNGDAEVIAAAGFTQALIKLFGANSSNDDIATSVTDDLGSDLFALGFTRTYLIWDQNDTLGYSAAGWMGDRFPTLPGSSTWKFKDLAGVSTDVVSTGQRTNLRGKNVNFYMRIAGAAITQEGITSGGQFIDITRGIDWLQAEIQVNVFALLVRSEKVPFTDPGIDQVRAEVFTALNQGITNQLLAQDPAPTVTAPLAANINPIDKANRLLPDVNFTATLAGAIHTVRIAGKVSV